MARTRPGRPAPDPMSATLAPCGTASATTAQLRRCRSQSRGTSRGPIRPRTTPSSASHAAYRSASGRREANTPAASSGAGGVSRETWSVIGRSCGGGDHHVAAGLDTLGLRGETLTGHDVVDDLALERRHRLQGHRLTLLLDLGDRVPRDALEHLATLGTVAADVEHEPR